MVWWRFSFVLTCQSQSTKLLYIELGYHLDGWPITLCIWWTVSVYNRPQKGQLSLAIPSREGNEYNALSTGEIWGVKGTVCHAAAPIWFWQCKLGSGWGLRKTMGIMAQKGL